VYNFVTLKPKRNILIDISLIILSGGESSRFGVKAKKQWLRIGDIPLWNYVTNELSSYYAFKEVIVTGSENELFFMRKFSDAKIIKGGATRQISLLNALPYVTTKYVLVSDAARVCIPKPLVEKLLSEAGKADVIVPYLPVSDTVAYNASVIDRDNVKLIQTPQLSITKALRDALSKGGEFTDESGAIIANGGNVKYTLGDTRAEKLTFASAKNSILSLLPPPSKDNFYGTGFDVHAFEDKKPMFLGGIKIGEDYGFKAHSDGDVAIHALIDALLGAAGGGDIGEWFPDTDSKYKNANSVALLENVRDFIFKVGFEIAHCDLTIIAQKPKISPYKEAISRKLSDILGLPIRHINVKATTTENMGFIGRSEGVAVQAAATLRYYDWMSDENINR
jgi:2-C-methyl-D-erythritol 4-phosphate cytidylyltransferase/2-C-methyl-D-erythritol 2,4-cyclodiphosphate synthase